MEPCSIQMFYHAYDGTTVEVERSNGAVVVKLPHLTLFLTPKVADGLQLLLGDICDQLVRMKVEPELEVADGVN